MELDGKSYRSLVPAMPLIYSDRGTPFQLSAKVRKMTDGRSERYWACDTLERTSAALYKMSGIKGGSSHSGRRSFATRVMEATCDIELVSRLLGVRHQLCERCSRQLRLCGVRHGYRPRLERLPYRLADDLAQALGTCDGYPRLSLFSESTVPKLFFIGSLGIQRFGPQVNFIFGTEFVVPRLLARVTAHLEGKSLCDPDLRVEAQADNG